VGSFKNGNETSGAMKSWEMFEQLRTCWLLKEDSDPQSYAVSQSVSYFVPLVSQSGSQSASLKKYFTAM
jgi:hypothetical protein